MNFAEPNGLAPAQGIQVFANARIVDPSQNLDEIGYLIVADGVIRDVGAGKPSQAGAGAKTIDCRGMALIPGLVDMRVHIGEPGGENRETIASASRAAAAGGVTTLAMMPDTDPIIDDVALVEFVRRTARETAITRVLPTAAMTRGFGGREMSEIGLLKEAGAVFVTEGNKTLANAAVMRRTLSYSHDFDMLVCHMTEDADLSAHGVMNEGLYASWLGLPGIPREAELLPLERDLRLVKLTGARYHAAAISTDMSAQAVAAAKRDGLPITAAATIQHLTLNENDIGSYRTFFKLKPPLRTEDDRQALVSALADGTIDVICSGHDPQDVDVKRLPFSEAAYGAVGLETLLSAGLRLVHSGDLTLSRLIEAMATTPARLMGIAAGTLAPGMPADLVLVDLEAPWVLDGDDLNSRSKNTAFDGARFTGKVMQTLVAGRTVYSA